MSTDVSGFGLQIRLVADQTFPQGITLTQFADDSDPFDMPSVQIADKAMGLNGDLITWAKPNPLNATISVVPNSDDDINLSILAEANRVGRGKISAYDMITMTAIYPDGRILTLTNGKLTDATPANAVATAGRLKSKVYSFCFENKYGV